MHGPPAGMLFAALFGPALFGPALFGLALFGPALWCLSAAAAERPNILWITSEDNGPHLGCYGDEFADTPNLDGLAARGVCYDRCWSNAPVCAPARTTIITGCYASRLGAQHMRCYARPPDWLRFYPQLLRAQGYYCTNNSKTDYNLAPPRAPGVEGVWDDSSGKAHWRNRPEGKPFFAVFNFTTTHESQTRRQPHESVHSPDEVPLPPYWPDTPVVRQGWAQYYDKMSEMDAEVGRVLEELEADGLADDTIVFYYSDHGPGFPRCKRSMWESGLRVPLIVACGKNWAHLAPGAAGSHTDRMVGFVDLAPTVLSLIGVAAPGWMDGRAFLGGREAAPRDALLGFRGRMDARYDSTRSLRDDRWLYVRNYYIDRAPGQHLWYMFQTPMTRDWRRLYDAGRLDGVRSFYWRDHPAEELYDLRVDPESLENLAGDPAHRDTLERLRARLAEELRAIEDTAFLPEPEMRHRAQRVAEGSLSRAGLYDFDRALAAADQASRVDAYGPGQFAAMLADADAAIRYWGAVGLRFRGAAAVAEAATELQPLLDDTSTSVRVAAAEAVAGHGDGAVRGRALDRLATLVEHPERDFYAAMMAWNAIGRLGPVAKPVEQRLAAAPTEPPFPEGSAERSRMGDLLGRLSRKTLSDLADAESAGTARSGGGE
ncbi:sulfatase [Botrimarina sp.]|uniref:sulfatase family protein n=1 Tax=Botrimarina sp. TaxID=2795802 RepID=UPI0032EC6D47